MTFAGGFPTSPEAPPYHPMDTIAPDAATSTPSSCCASDCCGSTAPRAVVNPERPALIREAFRLEWLTIAWMAIETVVAVGSGIAAGSLVLLAFGLDSVIELLSAEVLVWRLSVELRTGRCFRNARNDRPAGSAAACCSRSLPTSSRLPVGSVVTPQRGVLPFRIHGKLPCPSHHAVSGPAENRAR